MEISIIIPCYNNQESLWELIDRLKILEKDKILINHSIKYIFVDDHSEDDTFKVQKEIKEKYPNQVKLVKLTRNFGSYNSFLAGINYATGDCSIYLHADLQDPPELIPEMVSHYLSGYKLVIANRLEREDQNIFSNIYHKMVKKFAIKNIPPGGFDLILFDSVIREKVIEISEKHTNNVYLITWLGYPYVNIPYKREKRKYGKSQWKFLAKVKLFIDTFFSFGKIPLWTLRILFFFSLICFIIKIIALTTLGSFNIETIGVYFLLVVICAMLLIIGEYVDRIHETVRKRPNFVVEEVL